MMISVMMASQLDSKNAKRWVLRTFQKTFFPQPGSCDQLSFWGVVTDTRVRLISSRGYNEYFKVIFFNLMSFFWMFSGGTMFIIFKVTYPATLSQCGEAKCKVQVLENFCFRICWQCKVCLATISSACRWWELVT